MTFERKEGTFSVFKNTRKEQETHADFTGEGLYNGEQVWVNFWKKPKDKNGNVWFAGTIRKKTK